MKIPKGTKSFLSNLGQYNFFYISNNIVEFNRDCEVSERPYLTTLKGYVAVETVAKNIGIYEETSRDENKIIVWIPDPLKVPF